MMKKLYSKLIPAFGLDLYLLSQSLFDYSL